MDPPVRSGRSLAVKQKGRITPWHRVLAFALGCIAAGITYVLLHMILTRPSFGGGSLLSADTSGLAIGLAAIAVWTLVYLRSIRAWRKE
jgi:hypothetical protein